MNQTFKNCALIGCMLLFMLVAVGMYQSQRSHFLMEDAIRFAKDRGTEAAIHDFTAGTWQFFTFSRSEWKTYVHGFEYSALSDCLIQNHPTRAFGGIYFLEPTESSDADFSQKIEFLTNSADRSLIYVEAYNLTLVKLLTSGDKPCFAGLGTVETAR